MVVVKAAKGQRGYLQVVAAPYGIRGSGEFDATTEMSLEAGVGERCWGPGGQGGAVWWLLSGPHLGRPGHGWRETRCSELVSNP